MGVPSELLARVKAVLEDIGFDILWHAIFDGLAVDDSISNIGAADSDGRS